MIEAGTCYIDFDADEIGRIVQVFSEDVCPVLVAEALKVEGGKVTVNATLAISPAALIGCRLFNCTHELIDFLKPQPKAKAVN